MRLKLIFIKNELLMLRKVDGRHMCHLQELLIVTIPSAVNNAMIHMAVQLNHPKF